MLNIALIREVQASILDTSKPFDMMDWHCCIAGHTCMVKGQDVDALYRRSGETAGSYAGGALGLTCQQRETLFYGNQLSRAAAAAVLQDLIDQEELRKLIREQEEVLRGKLPSVARSETTKTTKTTKATKTPETKLEEPELVGA